MSTTLYWHDYETWGETPSRDKPSQFAGIRTDLDLNPIGEPLSIYCQPPDDCLPKPVACLVTGITPQKAQAEGLPDYQFMARIHRELSRPGTCGVGYNSIRFDDEVTRNGLFRNFYDPYEREWRNGNSRWDIIDMVRLTYALRPQGIQWPAKEDGSPSFRLEELSAANGLAHESAHDALSDVRATIALAKLIRQRHPKLYDYAFNLRQKREVWKLIDLAQHKPLLHISSKYPASRGCAALVAPLARHPVNSNGVIVLDLEADPRLLMDLSVEEIRRRLFTRQEDLEEGDERIPLKVVHCNKSPILLTPKMVDDEAQARLQLDKALCDRHWQQLRTLPLADKVRSVFAEPGFATPTDPEQCLYEGFLDERDKTTAAAVRGADAETLATTTFSFHDRRLPELLFRYRARNFPQTLSTSERRDWDEFRQQRLTDPEAGAGITLAEFRREIQRLREDPATTDSQRALLDQLESYQRELTAPLAIEG